MMFPSCGCIQWSWIVFTSPMFRRSMFVASEQLTAPGLVLGEAACNERRADLPEHLILRALDDRSERKHVLRVRQRMLRGFAVDQRRTQEIVRVVLDQPIAVTILGGHFGIAPGVLRSSSIWLFIASAAPGQRERRQRRFRIGHRLGSDRTEPLGERLGDLLGMPGSPDCPNRRCSSGRC